MALTLFFVPVRFRTLSESETAVSDSETAVSAAETTVSAAETTVSAAETTVSAAETIIFQPLKRPFSYFRTRKRYAKLHNALLRTFRLSDMICVSRSVLKPKWLRIVHIALMRKNLTNVVWTQMMLYGCSS